MEHKNSKGQVWYREPMMWLVVGGPLVVVCASIATYMIAAHQPDAPKNPDQDACKYCRAKTSCDALRSRAVAAAKTEFNLGITPEQWEDAALCAAWADAVQDEARKPLAGTPDSIKGWAMKPGARMVKFKDEKMVAELLKGKPEAFSLKSASSIIKLGIELPEGMIEETRKAASLVKVK